MKEIKDYTIEQIKRGVGPGRRIETTALVKAAEDRETKTGKPYVAMTVGDSTGDIECRAWDTAGAPAVGSVLKIGAKVSIWQDESQLVVDHWSVVEDPVLHHFIPGSHRPGPELLNEVRADIEQYCEDDSLARITLAALEDPDFEIWPAAKGNHHARLGGLIEHTHSMIRIAISLHEHYSQRYTANIDLGLVIAAIVFHDIGKLRELSGPVGTEYTDYGKLVGHITFGVLLLQRLRLGLYLDDRKAGHLIHLILSHHGRMEWGSPVEPATPEAILLHQIDMIDSRMDKALKAAESCPEGGWVDLGYRERLFITPAENNEGGAQ